MNLLWPILSIALVIALPINPIREDVGGSEREGVFLLGCNGCHGDTSFGDAGGGISFPSEPVLLNGQCTGEPGHCTGSACALSGRLAFTNNTHTTLYWSDDGAQSTHELPSGDTEAIYFNNDSVGCSTSGDTSTTYTFYTSSDGTGQLAGAFYTLLCKRCEG